MLCADLLRTMTVFCGSQSYSSVWWFLLPGHDILLNSNRIGLFFGTSSSYCIPTPSESQSGRTGRLIQQRSQQIRTVGDNAVNPASIMSCGILRLVDRPRVDLGWPVRASCTNSGVTLPHEGFRGGKAQQGACQPVSILNGIPVS